MMKIFIGGSRRISKLDPEVRRRLDAILAKNFPIVIGDANGADKAVQQGFLDASCSDIRTDQGVGGHLRKVIDRHPPCFLIS